MLAALLSAGPAPADAITVIGPLAVVVTGGLTLHMAGKISDESLVAGIIMLIFIPLMFIFGLGAESL